MLPRRARLRIASDDAVFGIPAGRLGAGYPLESVRRLVGLVGTSKAAQILLVAARFDAPAALAMGLDVSFAGMLTYKTADTVREVAGRVPHDRVMVETDCPYLAPQPVRGKRNEPAFVAHTAAVLAGLHGLPVEQMAERTTANARRLFGL